MISPTTIGVLLLASCLTSLAYGAWFTFRPEGWVRSIVKTVPVGCLAVIAWGAGGPLALTVALGLGALGDFWLSRPGERAFLAGLGSFAAAHVALVVLLWPAGGIAVTWTSALPVLLAGGMAALILPRAGRLAVPVAVYIALIAVMGVVAFQPGQTALVAGAAALFLLSDACLGISLFVLPKEARQQAPLQPLIWFTYWAAQMGFTLAFVVIWIT